MNKIVIYSLAVLLLVAVCVGGYKTWKSQKEIINLSNQLAETQRLVQETKSAYSVKSQQVSDLEVSNKELQKKIEDRDEDIAALGSAVLKWKDQYLKIKNATQTEVAGRIRVDFETEQDFLKVSGFCLTNPPEVEMELSWTRPLKLAFILTKKDNQYKLYLDSNSPDVVSVQNLGLRVDPSVFERRWFEKLSFGTDIGLGGKDPVATVRATFDISSFSVGPFMTLYNGPDGIQKAFGLSGNWRPFAK